MRPPDRFASTSEAAHDNRTSSPTAKGTTVLQRLRSRLTYANMMSTLAVFIALGGSSYAAFTISGSSIRNRSIRGGTLGHNTLTGVQSREARLGREPRAATRDRLCGPSAPDRKVKCPADHL